jgi:hypothetical protein
MRSVHRRCSPRVLLAVAIVSSLIFAAMPGVALAQQPTITASPESGESGSAIIQFTITGMTPGVQYEIVVQMPNGEEYRGGWIFTATEDGTPDQPPAALSWFSDPREPIGVYTVEIHAPDDSIVATTTFEITVPEYAHEDFWETWARTDKPVQDLDVSRTWMWGPRPLTGATTEPYVDSPDGERLVQYFDKTRMELNDPAAEDDDLWYVSNGLLVVELVSGELQIGDDEFLPRLPADVNIAGDPGERPTYADINTFDLQSAAATEVGETIIARFDGEGEPIDDPTMAEMGVTAAQRLTVEGIDHSIASPFWEFMTSEGLVFIENDDAEDDLMGDGELVTEPLFVNPFYATGFPITEAYWSTVSVGGEEKDLLWQCFERRCLTYNADNDEGWQVEAGNVGLHYWEWRNNAPYFPAPPVPQTFSAQLGELNESGVSGSAHFEVVPAENGLSVTVTAEGLEAGQEHMMHIHGFEFGEDFQPSTCPTIEHDTNDNGYIELAEGLPAYGGVIVALEPYPTAAEDGTITFQGTFETTTFIDIYSIVIHGMTADLDGDGESVYEPTLPVACGDIQFAPSAGESIAAGWLSGETEAGGHLTLAWNEDGGVSYELLVANVDDVTMASLYVGDPTDGGEAVASLYDASTDGDLGGVAEGTLTDADLTGPLAAMTIADLMQALASENLYAMVATEAAPGGVMSGPLFLMPAGLEVFTAQLSGANETTPVETDASGFAVFSTDYPHPDYSFCLSTIVYVEGIDDLTAAHIHWGAPGENGPVVLPLYPLPDAPPPAPGALVMANPCFDLLTGPLTGLAMGDLVHWMRSGEAYVNVHSTTHPAGEIRGQIEQITAQ